MSGVQVPGIAGQSLLDRSSPTPLWAQLYEELRCQLDQGAFGDAFPSEMELVERYGVSRNTVRDALRRLRAEGLVVAGRGRRPRRGAGIEITQPLGALYSLYETVGRAGLESRSLVRALDVRTDADAAARLGLRRRAQLLYLERLRLANSKPLAIDRVWFPAALARPLLEVDFSRTGFYEELAARTGVRLTAGREVLRAVVPEPDERRLLELGSGEAAFEIERWGFVRERPVEWRVTLVRGDRFSVATAFSEGAGYRLEMGASKNA